MTERERVNRLGAALDRLEAQRVAIAAGRLDEAERLRFEAALLVADATPAVQERMFEDARDAA